MGSDNTNLEAGSPNANWGNMRSALCLENFYYTKVSDRSRTHCFIVKHGVWRRSSSFLLNTSIKKHEGDETTLWCLLGDISAKYDRAMLISMVPNTCAMAFVRLIADDLFTPVTHLMLFTRICDGLIFLAIPQFREALLNNLQCIFHPIASRFSNEHQ